MPVWEVLERYGLGGVALLVSVVMWLQLDASDRRFEREMSAMRSERQRIRAQIVEQIDAISARILRLESAPELTEEQKGWRIGVTREFDRLSNRVLRLETRRMHDTSYHADPHAP